ncbi:uncharacterized protein LOC131655426 [Vicia villosa]|uniref:uncharacterized protein LOC131655426 n=1 Tax=Vicia villosa TaxID=3911 RepID=UPI00273CA7FB|nr:uncharacterized protein LOC131655426 [Vicia villosa]
MEGLLPLVLKAVKKNRTRRQYECLSSATYNISMAEIYPQNQPLHHQTQIPKNIGHRRCKTVGNGFQFPDQIRSGPVSPSKKLDRARSHRMLSCLTGGC